jgi:hypothetical protein
MSLDNPHNPPNSQAKPQPVLLSLMALVGGLVFLILISGGIFFYVAVGFGLIGLVGMLHYVLWGQGLDHQTEDEREEERLREEAQIDPW